jgi:hypothetical protein
MADELRGNAVGYILIFSFISVVTLFFSILTLAVINNYAVGDLYNLVNQFVSEGLIPSNFGNIADVIAGATPNILPVIDYIWFGAFVSMIISTLVYSYNSKRQNYFTVLTMAVLGIVIFIYIGSYFITMTDWFRVEILNRVFPTISAYTPIFNWYLDNIGVINLVLVVLTVIANFVDLDFRKFTSRKESESFDEI